MLVTPFVGVWIETPWEVKNRRATNSHTLRGCVDWNQDMKSKRNLRHVTPFVGVWIETFVTRPPLLEKSVTPFVGVWIETTWCVREDRPRWVTPFVGVWIETTFAEYIYLACRMSHPSWVCGLKQAKNRAKEHLKRVTPFVGVWIETRAACNWYFAALSHPSWVCGLKLHVSHIFLVYTSHTLRGCVDWNR